MSTSVLVVHMISFNACQVTINVKREGLEAEKKTWAATHGIEMSKFLARSTESLDGKRKKYTLPNNPFKFGRS